MGRVQGYSGGRQSFGLDQLDVESQMDALFVGREEARVSIYMHVMGFF